MKEQEARLNIDKKKIERDLLKQNLKERKSELEREKVYLEDLMEARNVLQIAAKKTQDNLVQNIEKTVTAALRAIPFKETYDFKIKFETRRNSTECDLMFVMNGHEMHPLESSGYGAVDVASFALRIAYWKLDGTTRNTIIWDEPFKNVDKTLHEHVGEMMRELSKQHNIQFIISTHERGLIKCADRQLLVEKPGKNSKVSVV